MTLLVMVKLAVPPLTGLLPRPGITAFNSDEKKPNNGISQRKPSRSSACPRPFQLSQSAVLAWVTINSPLRVPSSRFVDDHRAGIPLWEATVAHSFFHTAQN